MERLAQRFLPVFTIVLAASLALRKLGDFDTWWHLAAGRWSVENGAVPYTDKLSFTVPDHEWINLQWLFDVVSYAVFSVGGAESLCIFAAACFTLALVILMRNVAASLGPIGSSLLVLWTLTVIYERFLIRPEMFSFVLVGLSLVLLARAHRDEGRSLWLLVPLMILWVNVHSLFIVGVYCIATAMVSCCLCELSVLPAVWRRSGHLGRAGSRRMLMWGSAALLATLVNPYFVEGVIFPFELLSRIDGSTRTFSVIGEFRPPFSGYFPTLVIGSYQVFFFFSGAVVAVAALLTALPGAVATRREEVPVRFDPAGLLLFVGMAYLSLSARRNTAIFIITTAPFVAQCLAVIKAKLPAPGARHESAAWARTGVAWVMVAVLWVGTALVVTNRFYRWDDQTQEFGVGVMEYNFPIRAAGFAHDIGISPNLYNDMTAGGYLSWARPVDEGVFMDGRLEVYDAEFFGKYTEGLRNPAVWGLQAEEYDINSVILFHRWGNRHVLIAALARSPAWSLVYYDEVAVVFVRTDGGEDAIAAARELYPRHAEEIEKRLSRAAGSWQEPRGASVAAVSFATLLDTLGRAHDAAEYRLLALDLGLSARSELATLLRLSNYYLQTRQNAQAAIYLRRVLERDPDNERVIAALENLGV